MVKYSKGRNGLAPDLKWDPNTDSDCEDDSTEVRDGVLEEGREEGEDRAVLVAGSFSACVQFLTSTSC